MYAYLKGIVQDIREDSMILEVNQIGYNIKIAPAAMNPVPSIGDEMVVYTYTCVREDTFCLYGFSGQDDLDIFKKLIAVNGIGPKGGQAILSVMSADDLRFAIISGDAKAIAKAPGVGAKTAERVILDLKDKVSLEDTLEHFVTPDVGANMQDSLQHSAAKDAVAALTALGYSASDATKAVKQVEGASEMDTESILKAALKLMF